LLRDFPIRKIRNLGGKLGYELETAFGVQKAGELWQVDVAYNKHTLITHQTIGSIH
jgi:hypothetical protein